MDATRTADAIEFKGTSGRLNVFRMNSNDLIGRKALKFLVPTKANVIVVMTGRVFSVKK